MSVFSTEVDERASNSDLASDCEVAKDQKVSEVIKKFLQEDSDCESSDDDSLKTAKKDLLNENSNSRSNFSENMTSDEDIRSIVSENSSKVKGISSSASFRRRMKPIFTDRNDTDNESDASDSVLTLPRKQSHGKYKVNHDDGLFSKKSPHASTKSNRHDKTSSTSKTKVYPKKNTKEHQSKEEGLVKTTNLSHSINERISTEREKRLDGKPSVLNVGSSGFHHAKMLKRQKSDDTSSSNETLSSHGKDKLLTKNSAFQKKSSDKQNPLEHNVDKQHRSKEKAQHSDKKSYESEKYIDSNRKKEKSTRDILCINSEQLKHNKGERKSLSTESKKGERAGKKDEDKHKSRPEPGASLKGLSFFSCTTSSSASLWQNPLFSSEPKVRKQRSVSPIFVKVKIGDAQVFVESEIREDRKLWQSSRVNLTNCDNLLRKFHKRRKLDDSLTFESPFSPDAVQKKTDQDKSLEFSKKIVKLQKDCKASDHDTLKKSKNYDDQPQSKIKHLSKEAHNLGKEKVKNKDDRLPHEKPKQLSFHKHLTDKSDDKSVSKTLGGCLSKDTGSKSMHTDKSHDRRQNQSHREDSHHEKSHNDGKSHVNHSNHERKSNHKSKSRHHSKDSLKNSFQSFVEKEIKEQKSNRPEDSRQPGLQDDGKKSRLQENSKNFAVHVDSKKSGLNVDVTLCKESSQSNEVETIAPLKTHKKGISYILSDSEDIVSDCNENVNNDLSGSENTKESKNSELKTDFSGSNFELLDIGVVPDADGSELVKCNMDESKRLEDESANELPASEVVKGLDSNDASIGSPVSNLVMCDTESLKEAEAENLNDVPDLFQDNKVLSMSDEQTCDNSLNDKLLSDIFCSKAAVNVNSEAVTELSICPDEDVNELQPSVDDDITTTDAEKFLLDNPKKSDNIGSKENHEKETKVEGKELDAEPFPNVLPLEEQNLMRSAEDEAAPDSSRLDEVSNSGEDNSKTFDKEDGGVRDLKDFKRFEATEKVITSEEKEPLVLSSGDHSCRQQMHSSLSEDVELIGSAGDIATSMCSVGSSDAIMPSKLQQLSLQHFKTDPKYQPFVKLERLAESVTKKKLAEWEIWSKRTSHTVGTNQSVKSVSLENSTSDSERVDEKLGKRTRATEDLSTIEKRVNSEKRSISSVDDVSSTEPSAQRLKSDDDRPSDHSDRNRQETERRVDTSSTTDPVSRSLMKVRAEFKKQGEIFGRRMDKEKRQKHDTAREEKSADFLLNQKQNKISSFVIPKIKSSEKNEKKKKKPPRVQYETVVWTPPPPAPPRVHKPLLTMRASMEEDKDRSVLAKVEGSVRERENFQWQTTDNWRGSSSVHVGEWRRIGPPDRAGDRWNRQFGSYGCEQGNRDQNRDISKNDVNGRFAAGNSESSGFHRNVNSFGSHRGGNARQSMSSNWTAKRQQQEPSIEKKEKPSMEWIRLYNRDPLGLMTQSASDDRDGSVSPPGAADDGDDDAVDAVVKTGNRYETKSSLLMDDSNSMLENVRLLANTIQEVLTSGTAVSADKRQRLSEFHAQLQKSLILPSSEAPDNLALLNMICESVNQAKNFVTMFQSMMQEDHGSVHEEMSSSKKSALSLNHSVSPKTKNDIDLRSCPLSKQNDGLNQGNIGAYDSAIRAFHERHNSLASVQPVHSLEYLNAGKPDSVHSPASITLSRTPNSTGVAFDVGPKFNSSNQLPVMDFRERVNVFQDIDERKNFFAEQRFSRQFDDRTAETNVHKTDNYNSVSQISGKSNENMNFVCNEEFSNSKNESKCKHNTALDNSEKETKPEAVKSQLATVSRIEDELQLLEMLVTIQNELTEIDSVADSDVAAPSVCVNKISSTDSEAAAPAAVSTDSSNALSNVALTSPVGQTVSSSLADDTSQDSMQSSGSRKVLMPQTPSGEPRVVDPKILEDKVIGFARNALKPYYHRGVITSEEFKLIMRKVISKVKVKTEEEIKEAKIVQLIGAYVDRIVSQRKKFQL